VVDQGSDFPSALGQQIDSWDTSCVVRVDHSRLTTRGWNGYDEKQTRGFRYTTPKLRLDADCLTDDLLLSKSFHLICSPLRCVDLVTTINHKRKRLQPDLEKPIIIWEPVPDLCTPGEVMNCSNALPYIDICSPNQAELAGFLGDTSLCLTPSGEIDTAAVQLSCEQMLDSMPLQNYTLVIRCGPKGCYMAKNGGRIKKKKKKRTVRQRGGLTMDMNMESLFSGLLTEDLEAERERFSVDADPGLDRWIPAYFQGGEEGGHKVVDPTGGGNGFLGGLAVALARGKNIEEAAIWGSVAASFAIEQVGMPVLGKSQAGKETWNGVVVQERLDELKARIGIEML